MDCVFCKIANGEIPSTKVYDDDKITAFNDLHPQAPVHILIIPKDHISCIDDINGKNSDIVSHIFEKIPHIAKAAGLENGYRVISNCGKDAGQTVFHLHFHLLGGKTLGEGLV